MDHYPGNALGHAARATLPVSNIPLPTPGLFLYAAWKYRKRIIRVADQHLPILVEQAGGGAYHQETACPPLASKDTAHFTALCSNHHNLYLAGSAVASTAGLLAVSRTRG